MKKKTNNEPMNKRGIKSKILAYLIGTPRRESYSEGQKRSEAKTEKLRIVWEKKWLRVISAEMVVCYGGNSSASWRLNAFICREKIPTLFFEK